MNGWICKALGGAVVLLFSALLKRVICDGDPVAEGQTRAYLSLFQVIRRGIAYECAPLDRLLAENPSLVAACVGSGEALRVGSLRELADGTRFSDPSLEEVVRKAADTLGRGYREEQLTACDGYVEALSALLEEQVARRVRRSRSAATLIYTAAAGLILVLL